MASVYKLSYTAKEIDDKLGEIDNVVKITAQTLTDEQKAQARANIGAAAVGEAGGGGGAAQIDWADITNKPVITEGGDTLTWDGNTEGVTDDMVVANVFVWVSDAVVINANDIPEEGIVVDCDAFGGAISIPREHMTITEDGCFISEFLMIVPYDNYDATEVTGEPLVIPKKGNYLMGGVGPISITIPNYTGFTTEKNRTLPSVSTRLEPDGRNCG